MAIFNQKPPWISFIRCCGGRRTRRGTSYADKMVSAFPLCFLLLAIGLASSQFISDETEPENAVAERRTFKHRKPIIKIVPLIKKHKKFTGWAPTPIRTEYAEYPIIHEPPRPIYRFHRYHGVELKPISTPEPIIESHPDIGPSYASDHSYGSAPFVLYPSDKPIFSDGPVFSSPAPTFHEIHHDVPPPRPIFSFVPQLPAPVLPSLPFGLPPAPAFTPISIARPVVSHPPPVLIPVPSPAPVLQSISIPAPSSPPAFQSVPSVSIPAPSPSPVLPSISIPAPSPPSFQSVPVPSPTPAPALPSISLPSPTPAPVFPPISVPAQSPAPVFPAISIPSPSPVPAVSFPSPSPIPIFPVKFPAPSLPSIPAPSPTPIFPAKLPAPTPSPILGSISFPSSIFQSPAFSSFPVLPSPAPALPISAAPEPEYPYPPSGTPIPSYIKDISLPATEATPVDVTPNYSEVHDSTKGVEVIKTDHGLIQRLKDWKAEKANAAFSHFNYFKKPVTVAHPPVTVAHPPVTVTTVAPPVHPNLQFSGPFRPLPLTPDFRPPAVFLPQASFAHPIKYESFPPNHVQPTQLYNSYGVPIPHDSYAPPQVSHDRLSPDASEEEPAILPPPASFEEQKQESKTEVPQQVPIQLQTFQPQNVLPQEHPVYVPDDNKTVKEESNPIETIVQPIKASAEETLKEEESNLQNHRPE